MHICTECGITYGTPGKLKRGFCSGCWEWLLALQRKNARRMMVARESPEGRR